MKTPYDLTAWEVKAEDNTFHKEVETANVYAKEIKMQRELNFVVSHISERGESYYLRLYDVSGVEETVIVTLKVSLK